jgi:trehalose 6-phosphate synthase
VASNRLPVVLREDDGGGLRASPASGGLTAAMVPVLRRLGGAWVGWAGVTDVDEAVLESALRDAEPGHALVPVLLSAEERDAFYHGFSNEIVWPLFHDLQTNCNYDPAYWEAYVRINRRFARVIAQRVQPDDVIWVHDYHLILVGAELRRMGVPNRIGFFLHTPFPERDIFRKLPWRDPIARSFLAYDLVGFQADRDRQGFIRSLTSLGVVEIVARTPDGRITSLRAPGQPRITQIGEFPIGIDMDAQERDAKSAPALEAVRRFARDMPGRILVLGLDRLDYTKGIPQRLQAFRDALDRHPELHRKVTLVQVVVPSREDIPTYAALRDEIERLVGQINGELSQPGWVPVLYIHHSIERQELRGWYRAAQVALVTPLKDGMNLVAKEYCASRVDERGVLILSEFAGAASQLADGALIVNPNDRIGVAEAIARACAMPEHEQMARMRRLRQGIRRHDVFHWADTFLGRLAEAGQPPTVRVASSA